MSGVEQHKDDPVGAEQWSMKPTNPANKAALYSLQRTETQNVHT